MRIALSLALALTLLNSLALADPIGAYDASGAYVFPYGTALPPTLECAPNRVCELRLETAETIYDTVAGDTVHFIIGRGVEGKDGATPIIFFQPLDSCLRDQTTGVCLGRLTTNLIITTDRRTYEVRLAAAGNIARTRYGFSYPRDTQTQTTQPFRVGAQTTPPPTPEPVTQALSGGTGCLETARNYRIDVSGKPNYVPIVVCNDGINTYLSMPPRFTAPSIYTVLDNGQQQIVDTHINAAGIYAINGLPNHIILIGDVGKRVPHVDIWKINQ